MAYKRKCTDEELKDISRTVGKLGGRPPRYTPEELEAAIDNYFAEHNTDDNTPDWDDMLRKLNISKTTSERYLYDEEYIKQGYGEAIKKAIGYFTSFWTKYGINHSNCQSLVIFMLKQVHYGGYTDKQQIEQSGSVKVEFNIAMPK